MIQKWIFFDVGFLVDSLDPPPPPPQVYPPPLDPLEVGLLAIPANYLFLFMDNLMFIN